MKCIHDGCSGTLVEKPEEKIGPNVFECSSCHCVYRLVNTRKAVGCPSLKEYVSKKETKSKSQSLNASDASIKSSEESANVPTDAKTPDEKLLNTIQEIGDRAVLRKRGRPKGSKNKHVT